MTSSNPLHASDQTRDVLLDVANERRRQIDKGWTPEHDDEHHLGDMLELHNRRLRAAFLPEGRIDRVKLIEASAILVAAVEAHDRRATT